MLQAGDCRCNYDSITRSGTAKVRLPGETCTVCAGNEAEGYYCFETGNNAARYGPLCTGAQLGSDCEGKGCMCDWMTMVEGLGWRNDTVA